MTALTYEIQKQDTTTSARLGCVTTPHGSFATPAFMPVGTQGTVKGLLPESVAQTGAEIILGNTYHLMLRPGAELVAQMGGLHAWGRWPGPILTDSGGFQVFSLSDTNRINEDGVIFKSHLDGSMHELTPARSMQVQNELGADIIMAFDDCPPPPSPGSPPAPGGSPANTTSAAVGEQLGTFPGKLPGAGGLRHAVADPVAYEQRVKIACERSARWLDRCVQAHARKADQALFGIVQGGTDPKMRTWCVQSVCAHDLPGYAIGGVAVGEGFEQLKKVVRHTAPQLPTNKPRYLMGVGYERDILVAVQAGVDMFDCVLPTRNARNANAFTPTGQMRLRNAGFARDGSVIDPACDCAACGGGFSRSYLRHLFMAKEMLGPILVSLHNLRHFQRFLLDIRRAIADNDWSFVTERWPVAMM